MSEQSHAHGGMAKVHVGKLEEGGRKKQGQSQHAPIGNSRLTLLYVDNDIGRLRLDGMEIEGNQKGFKERATNEGYEIGLAPCVTCDCTIHSFT